MHQTTRAVAPLHTDLQVAAGVHRSASGSGGLDESNTAAWVVFEGEGSTAAERFTSAAGEAKRS